MNIGYNGFFFFIVQDHDCDRKPVDVAFVIFAILVADFVFVAEVSFIPFALDDKFFNGFVHGFKAFRSRQF